MAGEIEAFGQMTTAGLAASTLDRTARARRGPRRRRRAARPARPRPRRVRQLRHRPDRRVLRDVRAVGARPPQHRAHLRGIPPRHLALRQQGVADPAAPDLRARPADARLCLRQARRVHRPAGAVPVLDLPDVLRLRDARRAGHRRRAATPPAAAGRGGAGDLADAQGRGRRRRSAKSAEAKADSDTTPAEMATLDRDACRRQAKLSAAATALATVAAASHGVGAAARSAGRTSSRKAERDGKLTINTGNATIDARIR